MMPAPAPERARQGGLSILLAEDDGLNQQLASILLKKWGHRVTIAANGVQALQLHAGSRFDLILMDLHMPEMGGYEATAEIRRRECGGMARTVIVAMTADTLDGDRERYSAGGMDDYLAKPFRAAAFQAVLGKYGAEPAPLELEPAAVLAPALPAPAAPARGAYDYVAGLRGAEPEAVRAIGLHFVAALPSHFSRMRHAWSGGDLAALRREAHTLTGLFATFLAMPAMQLAAAIDRDFTSVQAGDGAARIDALEAEAARFAPALTGAARAAA